MPKIADIRDRVNSLIKKTFDDIAPLAKGSNERYWFGRNPGKPGGECTGLETYSPTCYDAVYADALNAVRLGHTGMLGVIARQLDEYIAETPIWLDRWGTGMGEDVGTTPCGNMENGDGDTDIWRHHGGFMLRCLQFPTIRTRMASSDEAIKLCADALYRWVMNSGHRLIRFQREYLRYGHRGSLLVSLSYLYGQTGTEYADPVKSASCGSAAVWLMYHVFDDTWATFEQGPTRQSKHYNYGDLLVTDSFGSKAQSEPFEPIKETRNPADFADGRDALEMAARAKDPFNYGWRKRTSQPIYDGDLFNFVFRLYELLREQFHFDDGHPWVRRCVHVVDVLTTGYDPYLRLEFPVADIRAGGKIVNSKLHGGTADGMLRPGETPMTLDQYEAQQVGAQRTRFDLCFDYHESDGKYTELSFRGPLGAMHHRVHKARVGIPYGHDDPDDPAFQPSLEGGGNVRCVPDMIYARGIIKGDKKLTDYALAALNDYVFFANKQGKTIEEGAELSSLAPPANFMSLHRPHHWARAAGQVIMKYA